MASRKRAKRKSTKSRVVEWAFLWALMLTAVLVAALFTSPLTRLNTVRVTGAAQQDRQRIEAILRTVSMVPALRIDAGDLERRLLSPAVAAVSFRANAFGRARLRLEYRIPVAQLADGRVVDEAGNIFLLDERLPPNLQILGKVEDYSTILTISDPSPLRRMARLAKKLQVFMPKVDGTVEIDAKEGLSLRIDGLVVEFGDTSRLERKVQVLADLFREDPQRAAKGGRIILVDPDNAVQSR